MEKYRANELLHARWAMLAAAGIIIPEALQACPSPLSPACPWIHLLQGSCAAFGLGPTMVQGQAATV